MTYQSGLSDLGDARPSAIEQLYEGQYALLLLSFGLFTDMTLLLFSDINLLQLNLANATQQISLGQVFILFTTFAITQSFVVPIIQIFGRVCADLVFQFWWWLKGKFYEKFNIYTPIRQEHDVFLPHEVRNFALRSGNDVAYSYVNRHYEILRRRRNFRDKTFSVGVLGFVYMYYFENTSFQVILMNIFDLTFVSYLWIGWISVFLLLVIPLAIPYVTNTAMYIGDSQLQKQIKELY